MVSFISRHSRKGASKKEKRCDDNDDEEEGVGTSCTDWPKGGQQRTIGKKGKKTKTRSQNKMNTIPCKKSMSTPPDKRY